MDNAIEDMIFVTFSIHNELCFKEKLWTKDLFLQILKHDRYYNTIWYKHPRLSFVVFFVFDDRNNGISIAWILTS